MVLSFHAHSSSRLVRLQEEWVTRRAFARLYVVAYLTKFIERYPELDIELKLADIQMRNSL